MAEESDEALEISSNEESGTDRDVTKESMDQSTSESLQSGSPTVISLFPCDCCYYATAVIFGRLHRTFCNAAI